MRIAALGFVSNYRDLRDYKKNTSSLTIACPCDAFIKSQPTFTAITREGLFQQALRLRRIQNLPCAYSGIPMVTFKNFNSVFSNNLRGYSLDDSLYRLSKFKKNMHPAEKAVFNKLIHTPAVRKAKDLQEAMAILRHEHLSRLNKAQIRVFGNINLLAEGLSEHDRKIMRIPIQESIELILKDNPTRVFKRKTIISRLEEGLKDADDKFAFKRIVYEAYKLPSSSSNQYAFIAKYSRNDRSAKEIEERLISPSISTFDHIVARDLGGGYIVENTAIVSKFENGKKSDAEAFAWLQDNQDSVRKNAQKQIDFLINLNNKNYLKTISWYILCLRNAFSDLSEGRVVLDISKLRIDSHNAKMIRKIQEKLPETFGNRSTESIDYLVNSQCSVLNK